MTALLVLVGGHLWRPTGWIGDVTYTAVTLGAGLVAVVIARSRRSDTGDALAWVAAGVTMSGVGDVCYTVILRVQHVAPDASIADIFYLASYVALGLGLLLIVQGRRAVRELDPDGLIDVASFAVLATIVVGVVVDIGGVFDDPSLSLAAQFTWAAYPILDAALLTVLLRSLVTRRMLNISGVLIADGVACWLASDFTSLMMANASAYSTWMDLGWMLGAAAMVAGASARKAPRSAVDGETAGSRADQKVSGPRVVISLCPLIVPAIIEVWTRAHGEDSSPELLLVASAFLLLLAIVRATRLVRARDAEASQLRASERYFQALAANSADAVIVVDVAGRIINDSPHLGRMLGWPAESTPGLDAIDFMRPVEPDRARSIFARSTEPDGVVRETEMRVMHADGHERWLSLRIVNRTDDPAVGGVIVNIHDVTDRKRVEAELVHRAFHDSLTGLANRALFHDRVAQALKRTERSGLDIAVVYLDVDGFKTLNDSQGHEAGDQALGEIAGRLLSCVRSTDTVARLGGDEFAILIESPAPLDEAGSVADRVLDSLLAPLALGRQNFVLSASIGITISDDDSTASSMLRDADIAMYSAKVAGKARWRLYEPVMHAVAMERLQLETDLHLAVTKREFTLQYQPIIELECDVIVGFEALLRWNHPSRGLLGPDSFIPLAEANGSIVEIGRWALGEACATAAGWRASHPRADLSMAVNISTVQLARPAFLDEVRSALEASGLEPSALVLEMTETVLIDDIGSVARQFRALHSLGVRLAIDDFGTGYSSLSYLGEFPIDILKIDRSFVHAIIDPAPVPAILVGLLELGRTLDMEIVAEGIESELQRDVLRKHRCTFGQGFFFARPLSRTDSELLLDSRIAAPLASGS